MRILIVDDSTVMRELVREALGEGGYSDVTEACDGRKALEAVLAAKFDLILMDWNMPEVDGLTSLKAMRKAGITTPVIMVTTESEKARITQAITSGANDYVIKPFETEQLVAKVKAAMARMQTKGAA